MEAIAVLKLFSFPFWWPNFFSCGNTVEIIIDRTTTLDHNVFGWYLCLVLCHGRKWWFWGGIPSMKVWASWKCSVSSSWAIARSNYSGSEVCKEWRYVLIAQICIVSFLVCTWWLQSVQNLFCLVFRIVGWWKSVISHRNTKHESVDIFEMQQVAAVCGCECKLQCCRPVRWGVSGIVRMQICYLAFLVCTVWYHFFYLFWLGFCNVWWW